MKIKEVEQLVGIGRANIRYYEKEGLLNPTRNNENNYREYTEEDVRQLQRIKVLRLLGVAPSDIKLLNTDDVSLENVMKKRLDELKSEAEAIQSLQKTCEIILERNVDMDSLNEDVLTADKTGWDVRLKEILERDMTEEVVTRKQVNKHMMVALSYGYFLNVLVSLFCGDFFLHYQRVPEGGVAIYGQQASILEIIFMVLAILCMVALYCQASVKWHFVIFHVSALITTPIAIEISRMCTEVGETWEQKYLLLKKITSMQFAGFWMMIILYVIVLYLISCKWEKMFTKVRYVLPVAAVFAIIYTGIAFALTGEMLIPAVVFTLMLFFVGIAWTVTVSDREEYNRYYVVVASARIMNIFGLMFTMRGHSSAYNWKR